MQIMGSSRSGLVKHIRGSGHAVEAVVDAAGIPTAGYKNAGLRWADMELEDDNDVQSFRQSRGG